MREKNTFAVVRTSFRATHCWPNCNIKDVKFLKNKHHHEFKVEVQIQQFHDDRDIEYLMFQRYLDILIKKMLLILKEKRSCEMMADWLRTNIMKKYSNRIVTVSVNEDGYYGALVKPKIVTKQDIDIAWLAGIIDGEGSIYMSGTTFRPCIMLGNCNKLMIDKAYNLINDIGVKQNKIFIKKSTPKRKLNRPFYRIAITGLKNVYNFLNVIEPFLISKKPQGIILKKYCFHRLSKPMKKGFGGGTYSSYDKQTQSTVNKLKKLNDSKNE